MMAAWREREAGFTLIEAIVALALMGLVLSALASITAQWLPNWNRGIDRIQRDEAIGAALQRIAADLAAAEYVPANRESRRPLFDGSELSITFVRTAIGPNAGPGLDVVHLGESSDGREFVTVRSRTRFAPLPTGSSLTEQLRFRDPVVLLRASFRLSFAYAGPDRVWKSTWREAEQLPVMIKLIIRDAASQRVLSVSTIAPVHTQVPSDCARPDGNCTDKPNNPGSSGPANVAGQGGRL
ncbi:prepilin-type N-terminal cleavage/methylation domain-containing protein [Bradyrhizobium sp. ISRA443]|uniref:PulJ/GspJ family protein n=1 Tax=unclassified Bradyrhizobium TaxID=2631580 RepID=UPI002479FBCC|nr:MULTISPECIES: type II secretion system protein [unclassified Bradyrhizobium]WGR92649.1 prepilin-type N-terminal cleavage/methylation domain-containing protein [Bradyrhizobium sp. ISRA435]WGR97080.1 prepilin-type N-terminal cleavage/methylation domain-containing protein [Bradyrhizobium sp. ISRA436]WGS03968.1 prepilin-type N-terminal cleavage/methylation domain-containing protein [Bradyrhizobium sp. ISRA437]WGS10851.1 prepilin-type N-terminal cleavage/methylation domain-containing protein [Bra